MKTIQDHILGYVNLEKQEPFDNKLYQFGEDLPFVKQVEVRDTGAESVDDEVQVTQEEIESRDKEWTVNRILSEEARVRNLKPELLERQRLYKKRREARNR